ncbi:hypothetical protein [Alkalihalobacterium elongatum]|uniref:hypothetical protein n=1 Tax=Alkalihalobacterium elongatum TaxID=2675466 RepID=UPI001C1F8BC4|nr:hypothetical protein [Alkalihalobacterium elongatum]
MEKGSRLILTALIGVLLLGGCGTKEQVKLDVDGEVKGNGIQEEQIDNDEMGKIEERSNEKTLSYYIEGELYEKTALLTKGDNQDFSMYLFKEFELVAEEPRKDAVVSKEDGSVFMRIEMLPNDVDINKIETEIPIRAKGVSVDYYHNETALMSDFLEGAVWYKAYTEEFVVSVILIKSKDQPMILTIHTPREKEATPPFLAMAETIE